MGFIEGRPAKALAADLSIEKQGPSPSRVEPQEEFNCSEDGSLTITVTPKNGGKAILDETIKGKKTGVLEVDTKAGATYDLAIVPEDQGVAVQLQIGSGTEPCTDPSDLDPPSVPGGNDGGNGGNGPEDVIDETISDNPLPNTGGPALLGLAVIALGLSVVGGATVVRTGDRRRDR